MTGTFAFWLVIIVIVWITGLLWIDGSLGHIVGDLYDVAKHHAGLWRWKRRAWPKRLP